MSYSLQKVIEHYQFSTEDVIGEGSSATVYLGTDQHTNKQVAVKMIDYHRLTNPYEKKLLQNEIQAMKHLKSPYIVNLYDIFQTQNNTYIFIEYCNQGDLLTFIKKQKCLSENDALYIFQQIVKGVWDIYEQGYLHRDLKPANILIKDGKFKISDFGFVRQLSNKNELMNSSVGTPYYMSPQLLTRQYYSSKSDAYSLGIILYELLYGCTPWPVDSVQELQRILLTKNNILEFPDTQHYVSEGVKDFIANCLQYNESQRYSLEYIIQHPLLKRNYKLNIPIDEVRYTKTQYVQESVQKVEHIYEVKQNKIIDQNFIMSDQYQLVDYLIEFSWSIKSNIKILNEINPILIKKLHFIIQEIQNFNLKIKIYILNFTYQNKLQ